MIEDIARNYIISCLAFMATSIWMLSHDEPERQDFAKEPFMGVAIGFLVVSAVWPLIVCHILLKRNKDG